MGLIRLIIKNKSLHVDMTCMLQRLIYSNNNSSQLIYRIALKCLLIYFQGIQIHLITLLLI